MGKPLNGTAGAIRTGDLDPGPNLSAVPAISIQGLSKSYGRLRAVRGARIRFGGHNAHTDRRGRAVIVKRFGASRRSRRYTARAFHRGLRTGRVVVRVPGSRRR